MSLSLSPPPSLARSLRVSFLFVSFRKNENPNSGSSVYLTLSYYHISLLPSYHRSYPGNKHLSVSYLDIPSPLLPLPAPQLSLARPFPAKRRRKKRTGPAADIYTNQISQSACLISSFPPPPRCGARCQGASSQAGK